MTSSGRKHVRVGYSWIKILLFPLVLLLLSAVPAHAQSVLAAQEEHGCSKEHALGRGFYLFSASSF